MSKYLELFAKAIGMGNTVPPIPSPKERSRYELEGLQELIAEERRREMGSASKGTSEEEEAEKAESETRAITFNEDIYILTGRKGK